MDKLEFPQALIDRIKKRRGRLHLYERFEPGHTALLVVDLQVHFMQPGSPSEMPSAREAAAFNFKTVMIADANAGRSDQEDLQTYSVCMASYGDVMMTDEAITQLGVS